MFFNIDNDDGRSIGGWLVLDNPAETPSLIVAVPGRSELLVQADILRADIRDLGIHSTGMVGFCIDERKVPGLPALEDVTLLEAETRLLIFRRSNPDHVRKKIFFFDPGILPQNTLAHAFERHFTMTYSGSEKYSLETMLVLINNHSAQSIVLHGRTNFNRYSAALNNAGFMRMALLREPFEEMAEKILYFKVLGRMRAASSLAPELAHFGPLIDFANDIPLDEPKSILAAFRRLDPDLRDRLSNPMTRLFGCNVDEHPQRRHVSVALENLAGMDVVGTKEGFDLFRDLVAGHVGRDVLAGAAPHRIELAATLGRTLGEIGLVADLLAYDLDLYQYASEAIAAALETGSSSLTRITEAPSALQ